MRLRRVIVVAVLMMAVAACRGDRETITGSYGSGFLAGSVVLDGIDGSPDGVEVSVRDTGMAMTLGADGRFAFSGVPENAVLDFRRADGIQASLAVAGAGRGPMLVTLGKDNAHKGSTRGNKNKDKAEFEGVIRTASAESITVFTSHQEEILIGFITETVIRKGHQILTPADLVADMRVHVRARKVGDKYVAQEVVVQEGEDDGEGGERPAVREYEGTVVSAGATELVMLDSHRAEVRFVLTAETVIRKGDATVAPADLLPGDRVHVKATVGADGVATAVQVIVQKAKTSPAVSISGTVLGVGGSSITVKTKSGEVLVQTDASTRIRKQGKTIAVSAILAGDSLSAKGKTTGTNTILASEIEVRGKSGHP